MVNMNLIDLHNAPVIRNFCYHGNRIITPHQPLNFVNFAWEQWENEMEHLSIARIFE